jgi:hypothetical protein
VRCLISGLDLNEPHVVVGEDRVYMPEQPVNIDLVVESVELPGLPLALEFGFHVDRPL